VVGQKNRRHGHNSAPTENEVLAICDRLERRLTRSEKETRTEALAALRRFIKAAAAAGGLNAPVSKSFLKRGSKDIRVDLELIKGRACVPAEEGG
jgi:hypothetical protein